MDTKMTDKVSQLSDVKLYLMLCLPLCIHLLTGLQISTKIVAHVIKKKQALIKNVVTTGDSKGNFVSIYSLSVTILLA